jgi:hypothetical protein
MDGNSNSGAKNIGSIAGASTSSTPSLLDNTTPTIDNENVECVGNSCSGPTTNIGTQNPSSSLPPKP